MKLRIYLNPNREKIPFNYAYSLCGVFHRWLGPNDLHNLLSLYSLGWLKGDVNVKNNGLFFPNGAYWDIGIYDNEVAERLIRGILLRDMHFYGMEIKKADKLQTPSFSNGKHTFLAGSPILLRKVQEDGKRNHITYEIPQKSSELLNRAIFKKGLEANLDAVQDLNVEYDESYEDPKTKLVDIKGVKNKGSVCPVVATGPPEAIKFLWTVGAGELTGSGFGSLDHTGDLYRNN